MGKVINFGGGNPVWKTGNGTKWEIKPSKGDDLYLINNDSVAYKFENVENKKIIGCYAGRYHSAGGFIVYPDNFYCSMLNLMVVTSTVDNGTEEFDIGYPGVSNPKYRVFYLYSVKDSFMQPKIEIDTTNDKVIIERNDASGEEVEIHIFMAKQ